MLENNEIQAKLENEYNKLQLFIYRLNYDDPNNSFYEANDKNNNLIFMLYVVTTAFKSSMFTFRNKSYQIDHFKDRFDFSPYKSLQSIAELLRMNGSVSEVPYLSTCRTYDYSFTFNGQPFPVTNPPIDDKLGVGTVNVRLFEDTSKGTSEITFSLED